MIQMNQISICTRKFNIKIQHTNTYCDMPVSANDTWAISCPMTEGKGAQNSTHWYLFNSQFSINTFLKLRNQDILIHAQTTEKFKPFNVRLTKWCGWLWGSYRRETGIYGQPPITDVADYGDHTEVKLASMDNHQSPMWQVLGTVIKLPVLQIY
jgi:hypothetical protein